MLDHAHRCPRPRPLRLSTESTPIATSWTPADDRRRGHNEISATVIGSHFFSLAASPVIRAAVTDPTVAVRRD